MNPEEAVAELDMRLRAEPWYVSAGVARRPEGGAVLFVYVTSERHAKLREIAAGWLGYEVMIRKSGTVRSLGQGTRPRQAAV